MLRKTLIYVRNIALGLLGVMILVLLGLQTSWGLTHTTQWVLNRLDLFDGASLTVDRIDGNVFSRVHLQGISLVKENADTLASISEA